MFTVSNTLPVIIGCAKSKKILLIIRCESEGRNPTEADVRIGKQKH